MSETKINSSLSSKFKKTQVNSIQKLPDITGHTLGEFYANSKLDIVSGEADIYLCTGTENLSGKKFLLKYYRRENAVKPDVLEKLKGVSSPFVAPVEGFGEYLGHQYMIRPYYEMSALSELLAEGTRFSEEELTTLIIPSIIEGLKVLHNAGILHKDLKPANLIPDDSGEHIVIINFDISSDAGKNTFVVTQTGTTPFYAAPEAMQGIFHEETDYYAVGITIFELFTGFTPFQNPEITSEEAARLASVSKIEFPESFPEGLKKLVLGLTYKDISHRNEKDNPNRRWGYDEVRRWLNGKDVPVPGESDVSEQKPKFPNSFDSVKHQALESLVKAMLKDPSAGIRDMERGILTHIFSLFAPDLEKICREAKDNLQKNTDTTASYQVFYRLMYRLSPGLKTIFCGGREFCNLKELGEAAIAAASSKNTGFVSEFRLLLSSFLDFYARAIVKSGADSVLLQKVALQISRQQCSDMQVAWIFGYAFSDKRNIMVGDKFFNDPAELLGYLKNLENEQGFSDYIKYIEEHREDLKFFATAIPEAKSREDLKLVLEAPNSAVFGQGELQFKNAQAFDDYVGNLLREKQTYRLLHILNTYDVALKEVSEKVWYSDSYDNLKKTVSRFVNFEEHLFPSVQDLKAHFEKLLQENRDTPEFFRKFVISHSRTLADIEKISGLSRVIERFLSYGRTDAGKQAGITIKGIKYPTVNPIRVKVGTHVMFGRYPQNNGNNKEPIEWIVLEVKGNEVLLISRYGLDCKQYHQKWMDTTWENCDLRKWLNHEFLKMAFSEGEKQMIKLSKMVNDKRYRYRGQKKIRGGNNTRDHVFCLSFAEAVQYFKNNGESQCQPTAQAKAHEAFSSDDGYCRWWLRSPGHYQHYASIVETDGKLCRKGTFVDLSNCVIRPALRLILNM